MLGLDGTGTAAHPILGQPIPLGNIRSRLENNELSYDLLIVGGGIAGSSLAKSMAEKGAKVLVVERQAQFRDRVRGEGIHPWGVAEAKELGLYDLILSTCGHELRYVTSYRDGHTNRRDYMETSPSGFGEITVHHPELQEVLLNAAQEAGAEVRRRALALSVAPGENPSAQIRWQGNVETHQARLVIMADGRNSSGRKWGGFTVQSDPQRTVIAGVLVNNLGADRGSVHAFSDPPRGQTFIVFPLPENRFRAYYIFYKGDEARILSGDRHYQEFIDATLGVGAPSEWYSRAEKSGPLAMFETADTWVDHSHNDNVVLLGDAASSNDPTWGHGQSLVFRGVRVLRDHLQATGNWTEAADAYAEEHLRYYGSLHRITNWLVDLYLERGPEADARRARALSRPREEQARPDVSGLGPEAPSDEEARRNFFGEE